MREGSCDSIYYYVKQLVVWKKKSIQNVYGKTIWKYGNVISWLGYWFTSNFERKARMCTLAPLLYFTLVHLYYSSQHTSGFTLDHSYTHSHLGSPIKLKILLAPLKNFSWISWCCSWFSFMHSVGKSNTQRAASTSTLTHLVFWLPVQAFLESICTLAPPFYAFS